MSDDNRPGGFSEPSGGGGPRGSGIARIRVYGAVSVSYNSPPFRPIHPTER